MITWRKRVNGLPTLPEKPFIGNFAGDTEAVDWGRYCGCRKAVNC